MKTFLIIGAVVIVASLAVYVGMNRRTQVPSPTESPTTTPTVRPTATTSPGAACRPTGCSGQLCADSDVVTTCEFRAEYACYRTATCERQANGDCGWTMTPELQTCLARTR